MGACFAKWRAVISIGDGIPSRECIEANVSALCRYAALCQEADIVPIVEPEVLMNGDHDLQRCYDVSKQVLKILFYQLYSYRIVLEGLILKPNMIIAGIDSAEKNSIDDVADATVSCLLESVPPAVPAIAFLSGGQSPADATKHLNAIHKNYESKLPWTVSFSFARAIQQPAIEAWKGKEENKTRAQRLLYGRAKLDAIARQGKYNVAMEKEVCQNIYHEN
jgi:fructose-bisphosphate aldolase class I